MRRRTAASLSSGSISRAAAMRAAFSSASFCQPSSRIASASSPSKARWATRASWRSRPTGHSSVPSAQRALEPGAVQLDGVLGRGHGPLEAALLGRGERGGPGRDELVEQHRQLARAFQLDLLPASHLRHRRPGLRLLEVRGDGLEPAGDGVQPLGERREVTREQEEQAVADRVHRERASLPDPQDLGVEDGPADVVQLELALERGRRRELARVDRLDLRQVGAIVGDIGQDGVAAAVAELVVGVVEAEPGREDRLALDHPPEARLDEVVEPGVGGSGVRAGAGRGSGRSSISRVSVTVVLDGAALVCRGTPGSRSGAAAWRRSALDRRSSGRIRPRRRWDRARPAVDRSRPGPRAWRRWSTRCPRRSRRSGARHGPVRADIPPSGRSAL